MKKDIIYKKWYKMFAILPHKTISGQWVWLGTIYKRRIWRHTGIIDEPFTEYCTLFDILRGDADE